MAGDKPQVDVGVLQEFERGLDPRYPERSRIPARVLGYGEISTVFEIEVEGLEDYALKRLPIFLDSEEIAIYRTMYEDYNRLLEKEVGLNLPAYGQAECVSDSGRPIFFIIQSKLPYASIGNHAIHVLPDEEVQLLVELVLGEMKKLWDFNTSQQRLEIAVDGQVSNWSIMGFDPDNPHVDGDTRLLYMDTSTPFIRVEGAEQLNPDLFLRGAPSFLVWLLKALFVEDVVARYYDQRRVTIDLIANFYKEQRPELIPDLIARANRFFAEDAAHLGIEPIREKDVRSYYREDAFIWILYLNARRLDRFIRTRLLRRDYPYILPGKIKR
jgi:hypothetical protein